MSQAHTPIRSLRTHIALVFGGFAAALAVVLHRIQSVNPDSVWIDGTNPQGQVRNATGNVLIGHSGRSSPGFSRLCAVTPSERYSAKLLTPLLPTYTGAPLRLNDFFAPIRHPDGKLLA